MYIQDVDYSVNSESKRRKNNYSSSFKIWREKNGIPRTVWLHYDYSMCRKKKRITLSDKY